MSKKSLLKLLLVMALVLTEFSEEYTSLYPIYAASPSPTASASASPADNSLQTKLKALQAEIASRASQLKQEVNKKLQNKAYVGFIKSKSSNSLTIASKTGSRIVNVNEYTVYEGDKRPTFNNLANEEYVAALGDVDESEVLTAKKIIRMPIPAPIDGQSPSSSKQIFGGEVSSIEGNSITIKSYAGQSTTLTVDDKTTYKFGKEDAYLAAVKVNKAVLIVSVNKKARFVYIIPYAVSLPKSKDATPAASPKASASPKK